MRGLGLMSGSSADGVDAAVLDLRVAGCAGYRGVLSKPFDPDLRAEVLAAKTKTQEKMKSKQQEKKKKK